MSTATCFEKIRVTDCRAVRGFLGTPVDGTVHSWGYRSEVTEYPFTGHERYDAGAGVAYAYNGNDGLHLTLADVDGFDLVVLRGGARTRLYAEPSSLTEPEDDDPLHDFRDGQPTQTAQLGARAMADRVSFFGTRDGFIADVAFYRRWTAEVDDAGWEIWRPKPQAAELSPPEVEFAPESLHRAMQEIDGGTSYHPLSREDGGGPLSIDADRPLHLITPPVREPRGLRAVGLAFTLSGTDPVSCTVTVRDPLNPRLDLVHVPFEAVGGQPQRPHLVIPPQVLEAESRIWVTLAVDRPVSVHGADGDAPVVRLSPAPAASVLEEAFAHRMFLLRSFFCIGSEARQWGRYRRQEHQESLAEIRYGKQYAELFMTLDQCAALKPGDDLLRQYREWTYLRSLDEFTPVAAPAGPPDGVPEWAWYPRQGWLEVRRIVEWWLDHRLVPTGEFGGIVGDDSDFYQQLADLPFLEDGGVGGRLRDSAAAFAELAVRDNLEGGINRLTSDGLHAYEEGINHLALMSRWFYGDPVHFERCLESARNMPQLTVVTADGGRLFRDSRRLGIQQITDPQTPGVDGGSAALMWHTTMAAADYSRNPEILEAVVEWADTWLRRMEPGEYATSIDVASGEVRQAGRGPFGARGQEPVFQWLHALTGDQRFVEPLLRLCREADAAGSGVSGSKGSGVLVRAAVSDLYNAGVLDGLPAAALPPLLERDPALRLFAQHEAGPILDGIVGSERPEGSAINSLYDAARWPDMFTSVEQYTDRIFFSRLQRYVSLCYLGGYCGRGDFHPTTALSWEGFGTTIGALVLDNRRQRLTVAVYSYADEPLSGGIRVWRLDHGLYEVTTGVDGDGDFQIDTGEHSIQVTLARGSRLPLALAPQVVTVLRVVQIEARQPIHLRPDLAISARELQLDDGTVSGRVHNIGSVDVDEVVVGVVDAEGQVLERCVCGGLQAPRDLWPKTVSFALALPGPVEAGWEIVVDPEGRLDEIDKDNNRVALAGL